MVFGIICATRESFLLTVKGNLGSMGYWGILADYLVPLFDKIVHEFKFMQNRMATDGSRLMENGLCRKA